jgi:GPH family glycoside/pentoside/hexuronide:cation symporter
MTLEQARKSDDEKNETLVPEFRHREGFAFLIAMVGVQLSSELFAQWGTYFYSPTEGSGRTIYVGIAVVALIFVAGRVTDVITDPWIGVWSDRLKALRSSRRLAPGGRRRPFIFWGSILMTFTGIAFWYPPVAETSTLNLIWGTLLMSLHWVFYTLAYIPLLALAPEIAKSSAERVRLGTWIAVGMTLGLAAAVILPGVLISMLDPVRQSGSGEFSAIGYQRVAWIFALISMACFQYLVWAVRERDSGGRESAPATSHWQGLAEPLQQPVFRLYLLVFGFFYLGVLAMQRSAPYWAELGLGGDEATMTVLGLPFMVTCLLAVLSFPWLARRFDLKTLTMSALVLMSVGLPMTYLVATASVSDQTKLSLGMLIYLVQGIGLGFIYVLQTPLLGHVIDIDAAARPEGARRREGAFNALHAMMVKAVQILSIVVATTLMATLGNSAERPLGVFLVGPVAGVFCLIAIVLMVRYPRLGSTRAVSSSTRGAP